MTERRHETRAELDPDAPTLVREMGGAVSDEDAVGYARADLKDALARIRDSMGPRSLDDLDRGGAIERSADERLLIEDVKALGAKLDDLIALAESASVSTGSLAAASTRNEERLAEVTVRFDDVQAAQSRASARLLGLTIALIVLAVIVVAQLVIDVANASGG